MDIAPGAAGKSSHLPSSFQPGRCPEYRMWVVSLNLQAGFAEGRPHLAAEKETQRRRLKSLS